MQWEYRVCETEDELNDLGKQQWELVNVLQHKDQLKFFMKRPIKSFKDRITEEQRLHAYEQYGNR